MANFHFNPKTGRTGKCDATVKPCRFGQTQEQHGNSPVEARANYERSMESELLPTADSAAPAPSQKVHYGKWADYSLHEDEITERSEIYVHPQGKIALVHPSGSMSVYRNGRPAKTSGSVEDLRAGRGAWKTVKSASEPAPTQEEFEARFQPKDGAGKSVTADKKPALSPKEEARRKANVRAGYPADSSLDASRSGELDYYEREDAPYHRPAAILPLRERGNPHKLHEMKDGEKMKFWNFRDRDGSVRVDSTFEVWEDGEGHYKAVVTAGDKVSAPDSTTSFAHDQTGGRMGDRWTCIGAFRPEEGGAADGRIPDKSMPIYTYK